MGWRVVERLVRDERGQDLIEYALLTAIVGVAGILVLAAFSGKMGAAYETWNAAVWDAWEPCAPGACH